jgi:hypothetical protein
MLEFATPPTLQQLLYHCSHRNSPHWEKAWHEFLRRYKDIVYKSVAACCSAWKVPRLEMQLSETVNDIVADVFRHLCTNNYSALKRFRNYECEENFIFYLRFICSRLTNRYMQSFYVSFMVEDDINNFRDLVGILDDHDRSDLYEVIIEKLRSAKVRKKANLQRDIHIFMLHAWSDFSPAMIISLPPFSHLSTKSVYNVIERMRNILKYFYPY